MRDDVKLLFPHYILTSKPRFDVNEPFNTKASLCGENNKMTYVTLKNETDTGNSNSFNKDKIVNNIRKFYQYMDYELF